jgi:hypothetical protein
MLRSGNTGRPREPVHVAAAAHAKPRGKRSATGQKPVAGSVMAMTTTLHIALMAAKAVSRERRRG